MHWRQRWIGDTGHADSAPHQCIGANDGLLADDRAIQNGSAHADETFVADGAPVHDRAMTDGHPVADDAGGLAVNVQHGVILHVGVMANLDTVDVATRHRAVPDAGMVKPQSIGNCTKI